MNSINTTEIVTLLELCCLCFFLYPEGLNMLTQILLLRESEREQLKWLFIWAGAV